MYTEYMELAPLLANTNISTLKITKSREIDIRQIKNSKLSKIRKRNLSKTLSNKNADKEKCKLTK